MGYMTAEIGKALKNVQPFELTVIASQSFVLHATKLNGSVGRSKRLLHVLNTIEI